MSSIIHMISDLHLCEEQPHLTQLFEKYIATIAPESDTLFVLGDLFEVWIGDDHRTPFNQKIITLFKSYSALGKKLYIGHGNRDFLLGEQFAQECGAQLIPEPYQFHHADKTVCVIHGDSLCTDDVAYMQMRGLLRSQQWQSEFLSQPVEARLAFAANAREQSKASQKEKSMEIMDVNPQAVTDFVKDQQCDWLIHGHTHRPNTHTVTVENEDKIRVVLSDWREQGHYLTLQNGEFLNRYFSL